jgi:Carboxypeptidase activation peptide
MNRSGYLLAVWAFAAVALAQEVTDEVSYEDFKLLRVAATGKEQQAHVLRLAGGLDGVQVWATHNRSTQIDLLSAPQILDQVRASLDTAHVSYAVIIENLQVSKQIFIVMEIRVVNFYFLSPIISVHISLRLKFYFTR